MNAQQLASLALLALSAAACSAPNTCDAGASTSPNSVEVNSEPVSGSFVLTNAGDRTALDLSADLSGLPELWPSQSAISDGGLGLGLVLHYQQPPYGGDGQTQMPRVEVSFDDFSSLFTSGSFPTRSEGPDHDLFSPCYGDNEGHCCPFGVRECQQSTHILITRVDGAPFPPVEVAWTARAGATVSSCPSAHDAPQVALVNEAP
jgi:hypothetical protein